MRCIILVPEIASWRLSVVTTLDGRSETATSGPLHTTHRIAARRPPLRLIASEGAGPDVALEVLGEGRGVLCDPIERGLDRAAERDAGALGGRAGAALPSRSSSSSMSARRFR